VANRRGKAKDDRHGQKALEAGFDAHIAKPIDVVQLRCEIAAAKKW
jgi:CheY-like chemotaxis protein